MSAYLGDFAEDAIVHFAFSTNAGDGGRESFSASLEEADIVVYSSDGDGTFTAMTLSASTIIISANPGSQVGVYLIGIDMNNDADFVTGKDYIAVLYASDETVDSQNVAAILAHWSCENRGANVARWAGTDVTLSGTTAKPEVDIFSVSDDATAANNIETAGENYSATRGLSGTALPAAAADAAGGLPISDAGGLDLDAKIGALTFTVANKVDANATHISGDSGAADNAESFFDGTGYAGTNNVIPTVTTVTNLHASAATAAELAKVPKSDSNVTWNATALASIQSEAEDALVAKALDHLVFASVTGTDIADNSIIAQLVSKSATADWDSYVNTTDSLEANRDNIGTAGAGLTAADDAVITLIGAAGVGLTEAGGDGDHLTAINLPNQTMDITGNITGNLSGSVGSVTGAVGSVTGAVGSVTGNVGGNVTGSVGSVLGEINTTAGTIKTLDALDTAQDTQHGTTQTAVAAVQADLPQRITKNTALAAFPFFIVLTSDHVTGATGKTVTATRSLDGAAFASCANAVSEIANGWYKIDLAAGDLNANTVALKFTATDCDARMITIVTQPT